jgi:hypothetical protein
MPVGSSPSQEVRPGARESSRFIVAQLAPVIPANGQPRLSSKPVAWWPEHTVVIEVSRQVPRTTAAESWHHWHPRRATPWAMGSGCPAEPGRMFSRAERDQRQCADVHIRQAIPFRSPESMPASLNESLLTRTWAGKVSLPFPSRANLVVPVREDCGAAGQGHKSGKCKFPGEGRLRSAARASFRVEHN